MARVIKRYDNRKLYDLEDKRYVSLREIAELVRSGEQVQVIDNHTGEDLTAETLTKVILEDSSSRPLLHPDFLHELLQRGSKVVTAGVDQLQAGVDRLIVASLDRLAPVREVRQEVERLRARLAMLEAAMDALETEDSDDNDSR
jgi:polyhydroxyalkanoate synthesis repressor PhaR